ncbi:AraC family transcriptional regulator [Paenibacillus filicis]|uniref:AraC family transcriptional regulator n=1 Tax=Paenibacillus filicis TaxID=669464 RepID=A0ABU9DQN5_9BACL
MLIVKSVTHHAGSMPWFEESGTESGVWTLIMVGYGKCVYWLEEEKVLLEKGDALLIPAGTEFYGKSIPSLSHEKYVVTFLPDPAKFPAEHPKKSSGLPDNPAELPAQPAAPAPHAEALSPTLPLLQLSDHAHLRPGPSDLLLGRLQTLHEDWTERRTYREVLAEALLLEALVLLNREWDRGPRSSAKHKLAEQMKVYIKTHYRRKLTKDELGATTGKSPNYCAALFREMTGQTIGDYVHATRVKTAVSMLRHSQLTVGDISEYVGYADASYFHRIFRRITGHPPSFYMREREEPQP